MLPIDDNWWRNLSSTARLCLVALWVLFIYVMAILLNRILQSWKERKDEIAANWPSIEGHVQFASVTPNGNRAHGSPQFSAALEYSYFVGEYRSGKYTQDFFTESEANDFAQAMNDKKVQIRYNPVKPDKSVLDESSIQQPTMFATRLD